MSMSVTDMGQRLRFVAVPLVLLLGVLLVFWLIFFSGSRQLSQGITLPVFEYRAPGSDSADTKKPLDKKIDRTVRDIFQIGMVSEIKEQSLDLNEVALGLVIIKGDKRFCLTNGLLFKEGGQGNGFTVDRIESNGVWYQVGNRTLFLETGEKVNVDAEGNVRDNEI